MKESELFIKVILYYVIIPILCIIFCDYLGWINKDNISIEGAISLILLLLLQVWLVGILIKDIDSKRNK